MPETLDGGAEAIPAIALPNALRIRQRLGQISTGRSFDEHLVPAIASLDRQALAPEELVIELENKVADYAEEHVMGIVPPTLESLLPKIINELVDNKEQKQSAFSAWEKRVEELKGDSVATSQHIESRYGSRHKLPRKLKKTRRKQGLHYRA